MISGLKNKLLIILKNKMTEVVSRIKLNGKEFNITVDCDKALAFKKGTGVINDIVTSDAVFFDIKKGLKVGEKDLEDAFGTKDFYEIAGKIVKSGEVQVPSEQKSKEKDGKIKQVIDFISTHCTDPAGKHHPPTRIESALKQANIKLTDRPVDDQMADILKKIQEIIPIHLDTKKFSVRVPAMHTGQTYGAMQGYVEKEDWASDGSLLCVVNIPAVVKMNFFDKINRLTHGSAVIQEEKE